MSKQPIIPPELSGRLDLTPRQVRRVTVHLEEDEIKHVFDDNTLLMKNFFLLTVPKDKHFRYLVITAMLAIASVIGGYLLADTDFAGPSAFCVGLFGSAAIFFTVKARKEHLRNTRHARAIAALYSTKRFRSLRPELVKMTASLYGYFKPQLTNVTEHD